MYAYLEIVQVLFSMGILTLSANFKMIAVTHLPNEHSNHAFCFYAVTMFSAT